MSKEKKANKKKAFKKSVVTIVTTVLCLLLISGFLIFYLINENKYYEIETRVKEVKEKAKEDSKSLKTVGWVRVQGTNIDYRVIYAPTVSFSLSMGPFGWTNADFKELNNIIYIMGHNILNLSTKPSIADEHQSRFEQLMSFTYLDFVKENKYIQYTFNNEEYLYKIFAVSYPNKADVDLNNEREYSKAEIKQYIKDAKKISLFDFDLDVDENDKIISLLTCTRMYGNKKYFKVDARLVRKYELINDYDVKATDEYKKVKEKMEGGCC